MDGIDVSYPGKGTAVVALHEEHDVVTSTEMEELLLHEVSRNTLVVVDVSEAVFIDSSFLHNLIRADRSAKERGSHLVLQMGTAHVVRRALEISGLLDHLDVAHTRAAAISRA